MKFKARRELKRTRIEIIPMIDTMFFLLVFFMLSSLALTRLNGLPVNLPRAASASKQASAELTVTLDRNQKLYVNKTPVTFATLERTLLEKAGAGADLGTATVIINADASVPHGLVVRCIDGAREVGIARFAIATAPDAAAPDATAPDAAVGDAAVDDAAVGDAADATVPHATAADTAVGDATAANSVTPVEAR